MRQYDYEENNDENNDEVDGFFEQEGEDISMELIDMVGVNFETLRFAVEISKSNLFWRFYRNTTKLKIIEETYKHLNTILG